MKKNSKYIKIINCILILFVSISLFMTVFIAYFKISGADIHIGGMNLFKIVSDSMEPVYGSGDYVVVVKKTRDSLAQGDIIAFTSEDYENGAGHVIVHRINSVEPGGDFITRGDANPIDDYSTVSYEQIIGRVAFTVPWLRGFDKLFSSVYGFILIIALPLFLIIVLELVGIVVTFKRRRGIRGMIEACGLNPGDQRLYKIAEKHGFDAVLQIAEIKHDFERPKENVSDE